MLSVRVSEFLSHLETDDGIELNMKVRELIKLLESKQWGRFARKAAIGPSGIR